MLVIWIIVVCFSTNSTLQYIYCIVGDGDDCTVTVATVSSTVTVTPSWCIDHNSTSYSPLCSPSILTDIGNITITSENFPYYNYIGTLVLVLLLCCCIFGWTCCICCSCIHKRTQKNEPISTSKNYFNPCYICTVEEIFEKKKKGNNMEYGLRVVI